MMKLVYFTSDQLISYLLALDDVLKEVLDAATRNKIHDMMKERWGTKADLSLDEINKKLKEYNDSFSLEEKHIEAMCQPLLISSIVSEEREDEDDST